MTPTELAYFAGLIDGEGSISIGLTSNNGAHQLRLSVWNTVAEPLRILHEEFGGWFRDVQPTKKAGVKGRPYKRAYQWCCVGPTAALVLRSVQPYLIIKKQQCVLGLALQDLCEEHFARYSKRRHPDEAWELRETYRAQMFVLNGRKDYVRRNRVHGSTPRGVRPPGRPRLTAVHPASTAPAERRLG